MLSSYDIVHFDDIIRDEEKSDWFTARLLQFLARTPNAGDLDSAETQYPVETAAIRVWRNKYADRLGGLSEYGRTEAIKNLFRKADFPNAVRLQQIFPNH